MVSFVSLGKGLSRENPFFIFFVMGVKIPI
jgi:hypothetical protein